MIGRTIVIAILGCVGVVAPFVLVRRTLETFYPRAVTGLGAPIESEVAGFGCAILIAGLVFYTAASSIRNLRRRSSDQDLADIPHADDLPE